ncbi:tRNA(adenine34) deaminase [Marchantia polymorpha subsp. ruderalis]|uniref:tRNA(adenine(34)) deaminase n=1 Tax=Marchantia polymorpha TaxID=3197 RepID=A0A2R6WNE2_MARPO|nr:hypothetical protein MARPO_0072s0096 [Marchantia polymorpha]BBN03285.1 hypothetical protein Mp_2g22310 [Marchantia polymorpha subsp. ruderalis]|eukprot:PTQ35363.1 hypothetical protein MARPO_0072s0096 [Marchantia polymorpha]
MDTLTFTPALLARAELLKRIVGGNCKAVASRAKYAAAYRKQHPRRLLVSVQESVKTSPHAPFLELIGLFEGVRFELYSSIGTNGGRSSASADLKDVGGGDDPLGNEQQSYSKAAISDEKQKVSSCTDDVEPRARGRRGHREQESEEESSTSSGGEFPRARTVVRGAGRSRDEEKQTTQCQWNDVEDEKFMLEALLEAKKAASLGEVPVGAVVVQNGRIIARAFNRVEAEGDPTAHAEMLCIRSASKTNGDWRLTDASIYVTMEPCAMCAGALLQARVKRVVWGARNKLLGADGSWVSLFPNCESHVDGEAEQSSLQQQQHPFHKSVEVRREVLSDDCSMIMRTFFRSRRKDEAPNAKKKPWWLSFEVWVLFRRLLG